MIGTVAGARFATAALAGAGLLLAACGASPKPTAGPATVRAAGTASAGTASHPATGAPACPAPGLAGSAGASGAAAGTRYMPVDFARESGNACLMDGYPVVWFVTGEGGARIGPSAVPDVTQGRRQQVTVNAGGSAHFWLEIPTAANWPASSCQPVTAHWLRIVPPGQVRALYVRLPYGVQLCSARASGFNLGVTPVRPGRGVAGHTP